MKRLLMIKFFVLIILFTCKSTETPVIEVPDGYQVTKDTDFSVILQTPLSSDKNERGDQFITLLTKPLVFNKKVILPEKTQIRGLVKRVKKYEKLGDRAGLLLLFDQIGLPNEKYIPLAASLDTDRGEKVLKIKGKEVQDAKIIGGSAIAGALVGKAA